MTTRTLLTCPDCGSTFCRDHLRPRIAEREPKTPLAHPSEPEFDALVRDKEAHRPWQGPDHFNWCPTCKAYRNMEADEVLCDTPRD